MGLKIIGTFRRMCEWDKSVNMQICGYRLYDTETGNISDLKINEAVEVMQQKGVDFTLKSGGILEPTDGLIDNLPMLENGVTLIKNDVIVIVKKIVDANGAKKGFKATNYEGKTYDMREADLIRVSKEKGLKFANAKIVNKDGVEFISALKGSFEEKKIESKFNHPNTLEYYKSTGKYDECQLSAIEKFVSDTDIRGYVSPDFTGSQMLKIFRGVREGVNVAVYYDKRYSANKMHIILVALLNKVDPTLLLDHDLTEEQMSIILKGMQLGVDANLYADKNYVAKKMEVIMYGLKRGKDYRSSLKIEYSYTDEQYYWLLDGAKFGVDLSLCADPRFSADRMAKIVMAMKQISVDDARVLARLDFDSDQMRVITEGYKERIDASLYADPSISWDKMLKLKDELIQRKKEGKEGLGKSKLSGIVDMFKFLGTGKGI